MHQFHPRPDAYAIAMRRIKWILVMLSLLPVLLFVTVLEFQKDNAPRWLHLSFYSLILTMMVINYQRGRKKNKATIESYRLHISESIISREMSGFPTLSIPIAEITRITQKPSGQITITGKSNADIIGIPVYLEGMDELKKTLTQIRPIEPVPAGQSPYVLPLIATLLVAGLMIALLFSTHLLVIGVSALGIVMFLAYSFITTLQNPYVSQKIKRYNFAHILIIISVIMVTLIKLLGIV